MPWYHFPKMASNTFPYSSIATNIQFLHIKFSTFSGDSENYSVFKNMFQSGIHKKENIFSVDKNELYFKLFWGDGLSGGVKMIWLLMLTIF